MKQNSARVMSLLFGAAMASPAVSIASDVGFDFGGYLRAGPQATTNKNNNRACYKLAGAEFKYRLGNECELYGEFLLTSTIKQETGESIKVHFMPNVNNPNSSDAGDAKVGVAQMYVEMSGLDFAPNASFWGGKRFHRGADVHIIDKFFEQLDGTGAGASFEALGGKFDLAYYRTDDNNNPAGSQRPGNRLNFWLRDLPLSAGGSLNVLLNVTKGDFEGGKSGADLSLRHTLADLWGGSNNAWLQLSQGSAGLTGNFGTLTNGSDVKKWRLADGFQGQFTKELGGQAFVMYQKNKADAGDSTISSIGGRLSYAFSRNFKLLTDLGIDRVKPSGGTAANLTKLTIAPTLSTGPGWLNRPELRLYVTRAKWNSAANDQANAAYIAANPSATSYNGGLTGAAEGRTSGTSYGFQLEAWF